MARFFHELAAFIIGLFRAIIWFVVLVALLLIAYCAVRAMDLAYDYVNKHWFGGDDSAKLVIAAAVLMGIGALLQMLRRLRSPRRNEPPDRWWPLVGPPRDGQR